MDQESGSPSASILLLSASSALNPALLAQTSGSGITLTRSAELDRLISALANRNSPPKIIGNFSIGGAPGRSSSMQGHDLPLFSEDYDWAEECRVRDACQLLVKSDGEELWLQLMEHLDDKRYSFTCLLGGFGKNVSIADICHALAYRDLMEPFRGLWPNERAIPVSGFISKGAQAYAPPPHRNLKEWYFSQPLRSLWKLQAEMGEWGIKKIESLKDLPEDERRLLVQKTESIVNALRRSKTPTVDRQHSPYFDQAHFFNAEEAATIRDAYRRRAVAGLPPQPATDRDKAGLTCDGKTLKEWIVVATSPDPNARAYAAKAIATLAVAPANRGPAHKVLVQLLTDENGSVRRAATSSFEILGPEAEAAVPALTTLLKSDRAQVRAATARALGAIGPRAVQAAQALTGLLSDRDLEVRQSARAALDSIDGSVTERRQ